jgi:hypothetical protein
MWGGVRSNYGIVFPEFPAPPDSAGGSDGTEPMDAAKNAGEEIIDQKPPRMGSGTSITCIAVQIKITELLSLKHLPFEEPVCLKKLIFY